MYTVRYSQTQQTLQSLYVRTFTCMNVITVSVVYGNVFVIHIHIVLVLGLLIHSPRTHPYGLCAWGKHIYV